MTVTQIDRALREMGNTHSLDDILTAIREHRLHGFVNGDSWVVTEILQFPRRRVLEVFLCVGKLEQLQALHDQILDYGRAQGCDMIRAIGRDGWSPFATSEGWHHGSRLFWKEL